ncbi:unnamed protein product [Polarella glacialis]|uniref:Uncharacterized protein n=1 Tax=Polarella glacialis TaxID=89957 RepID=A0A813LLK3_POLGL|nr:unnamed protein product [Polarella glacialis]
MINLDTMLCVDLHSTCYSIGLEHCYSTCFQVYIHYKKEPQVSSNNELSSMQRSPPHAYATFRLDDNNNNNNNNNNNSNNNNNNTTNNNNNNIYANLRFDALSMPPRSALAWPPYWTYLPRKQQQQQLQQQHQEL